MADGAACLEDTPGRWLLSALMPEAWHRIWLAWFPITAAFQHPERMHWRYSPPSFLVDPISCHSQIQTGFRQHRTGANPQH